MLIIVSHESISLLPFPLFLWAHLCACVCSIRRTAGIDEPSPIRECVLEERAVFILRLSLGTVGGNSGFLVEMGDSGGGKA